MSEQRPSPPEESQEVGTEEARSGKTTGVVRYILVISTALSVVAFVVAYLIVT